MEGQSPFFIFKVFDFKEFSVAVHSLVDFLHSSAEVEGSDLHLIVTMFANEQVYHIGTLAVKCEIQFDGLLGDGGDFTNHRVIGSK